MNDEVLTTTRLTKEYGSIEALKELSVSCPRGITGLLGPNGAGKSTLISIILGLEEPTSGEIKVLGSSPLSNPMKVKERVGWAPEEDFLNVNVPADEFLLHVGQLSGLGRVTVTKRLSQLALLFGMGEEIHRNLKTFSRGLKQKVKLIGALIHDPDLVILDEPLKSLDPHSQGFMLSMIKKIARELNKDLIIATHLLEVAEITDYVIFLRRGRKVFTGKTKNLMKGQKGLRLQVGGAPEKAANFAAFLRDQGVKAEYEKDRSILIRLPEGKDQREMKKRILKWIDTAGVQLKAFLPKITKTREKLEKLLEER